MKASVKWVEDMTFMGETGSGHAMIIDGPPDHGGHNRGMRPMELLLLGMAGCTAVDVIAMLRKGRQQVADCVVDIAAERADSVPKVFTRIHAHYRISGHALKESQVRRAVELSAEKYCSASVMLGKTAEISHDFEIIETG